MRKSDRAQSACIVRCAIYTRKSSEDGLEQEFNSLDAQREACESYIISQRHAGWIALPDMYDDGGLSGGTMERPALQRLLAEVAAKKIQIIVVYKVDRLTRSLADFAKIVDVLDAHGASFVSVTQQFNTTTSMGRLTLNMLLSFAQFEREIAGERIRDKIAASKAKGMWMGGNVPLGYDVKDRKLVVNEAEAATVRMIFRRYAELGSVSLLKAELDARGVVSKRREGAQGKLSGGKPFSRGNLYLMLQNRLYVGEIAHKGNIHPGQQEGIIDAALWQAVQDCLSTNRVERSLGTGAEESSLLASLIFDTDGERLSPTHSVKKGKRYRYYVSAALIAGKRNDQSKGRRIPAGDIEGLVLDRLRALFASEAEITSAVAPLGLDAPTQRALLGRSKDLAERWTRLTSLQRREIVLALIPRIEVDEEQIFMHLDRASIPSVALPDWSPGSMKPALPFEPLVLSITASLQRAGKGIRLVIGGGAANAIDSGLASLVAKAISSRAMLFSGQDDSVEAMAARLGVRRDYLAVLLRLSYLSPDIVRAILAGQHPVELTPTRLIALSRGLPHDWQEQKRVLGFPTP
ncbi:recombinase family protein [Methylocystis sp. H4A]|uniref:recombinase family protein n=1 Tax=Methylocystis sp. H4A TaxID=2785788 RepID=UPI0018C305D3|nr:recombinase family protein [Methylocystis sp. H4A]